MRYFAGFDPGVAYGFAILDQDGHRVTSGVWRFPKRSREGLRLANVTGNVRRLFETIRPERIGFEVSGFLPSGAHAGLLAGAIYGATLLALEHLKLTEYHELSPSTVKKVATGKGHARKREMVLAANARWGLGLEIRPGQKPGEFSFPQDGDDHADALWIAETVRQGLLLRR